MVCGLLISILGQAQESRLSTHGLSSTAYPHAVHIYLAAPLPLLPLCSKQPPPCQLTMRTTSLIPVLAALISIASTFPVGFSAHQGRVAARDPAKVRSPATPSHLVARAKPSSERRHRVPRQAPSPKPERDHVSRQAHPSLAVRHAPRAEPSGVHHRRDEYVPRRESEHTKRSPQGQNVFGNKIEEGLGWDEEQCPTPLSACPVRGASEVDAIECVDVYSDLSSCGGCAADDIACVFSGNPYVIFSPFFLHYISSYDCNAIPYARGVECVFGSCKVHSCADGYVVAPPRDVCVPVGAA
jgi:hypothetical protein